MSQHINDADLCAWLREHSSGAYRNAEVAADRIEELLSRRPDSGKVAEALHAAVSALYFDDSSDFRSALGAVVRHLDPNLAGELLGSPKKAYDKACAMLAAPAADSAATEQADPMDWPLPCDVKVGHGTIGKGCKLRTLVARMQALYDMAHEGKPSPDPEFLAALEAVRSRTDDTQPAERVAAPDTYAIAMLVAEAAYKAGSGIDRAVASDKLREIVFDVMGRSAALPKDEDGERYRFLRHADLDDMAAKYWPGKDVPEGEEFDRVVDLARAALSASAEKGET